MKIQTALTLAALLATVPEVAAQRGGRSAPAAAPAGQRVTIAPRAPSTNILPMSNPVMPIANPVLPFIPYRGNPNLGNPSPQLPNVPLQGRGRANPPQVEDRRFDPGDRFDRNDRRRDDIIVVGGAYYDP